MTLLRETNIADKDTGATVRVGAEGCMDTNVQDQHTRAFDVHFSQQIGGLLTLAVDAVINDYTITLTTGHGALVGQQLVIYDVTADRLYVGIILTVVTDLITLDTPVNFSFLLATSVVALSTRNMNVDGSVTRQTFKVSPPITSKVHITRVMLQMTTTALPELDKFGDITGGITRGIILRVVNGINVNLFNVKTNGELVALVHDVKFYDGTQQGVNGLGARLTYGGQDKHGVVVELDTDESLELIIQDDLTTILSFTMIASGHVID